MKSKWGGRKKDGYWIDIILSIALLKEYNKLITKL